MTIKKLMLAGMMACVSAFPVVAASDSVGKISAADKGAMIMRDGKLLQARAGDAVYAGDRVVTRDRATAKIAMNGCSRSVGAASTYSVSGGCDGQALSVAASDVGMSGANAAMQDEMSSGGSSEGIILGVLAAGAVGLGIYAAVDGDTDDAPVSP